MMIKIWKYLHTLSVSLPWEAFIKLHFMVQKTPPLCKDYKSESY